jgi:hypothetical protein
VSEIRALNSLGDIDRSARLAVDKSMTLGCHIVIGGFGPVKTGFGERMTVPLGNAQLDEDPGIFAELTYEQALDLNAKLAAKLSELATER